MTAAATWTSSDPDIAVIDPTGLATTIDAGQTTIGAAVGSINGSTNLTVTPGQLDAVVTPTYQASGNWAECPNQKAVVVGADGFSRFLTGTTVPSTWQNELAYVRCLDPDCVSFHATTVATAGTIWAYSIALGPDGYARIAYSVWSYDPNTESSSVLHFIQCSDDDCTSPVDTAVDEGSDNGVAGIAVGSDGTSYIVYDYGYDFYDDVSEYDEQGVGLATCGSRGCSTSRIAPVDVYDAIGAVITIGTDGNPAIVYEDSGNSWHDISDSVHYYANGSDVVVSSSGAGGNYSQDVAIGQDGFARIAVVDGQTGADFIQCTNAPCSANSASAVPFEGVYMQAISVGIGPDGNAVIEGGSDSTSLDYVRCTTANCSSYTDQIVPGSWEYPWLISLNTGQDGFPRMIAQDQNSLVDHVRPKVPSLAVIISDDFTTYSNETWTSCDGKQSQSNQYGYQHCLMYLVEDQDGNDLQRLMAVREDLSIVDFNYNVQAQTIYTATNDGGQFGDMLALLGSSPLPPNACSILKQTMTVTGNSRPIRVNCLRYGSSNRYNHRRNVESQRLCVPDLPLSLV